MSGATGDRIAFDAEILQGRGGGAFVEIPFSVEDRFGTRGRLPVRATFEGHEYRGSIAPMGGGVHVLGVRKDVRAAIGRDVGDRVRVTIELDRELRSVDVPHELRAELEHSPEAQTRFERLSYTHRREFAQWVSEAKMQETRERRARKAVQMLCEGRTR